MKTLKDVYKAIQLRKMEIQAALITPDDFCDPMPAPHPDKHIPETLYPKYALVSNKSYYEIMQDPQARHAYNPIDRTLFDVIVIPSAQIPDDQLEIR